ncbi:hypothetical protein M1E08_03400 [Erwinia sp. PK3-005]
MSVIAGFHSLLKVCQELPDVGWIYVEPSFDLQSENDIRKGSYFLADNEDEEMDYEDNYGTFLEAPIFKAIIQNKLENNSSSNEEDFLEAVVYYLENDDFLD